MAEAAERFQASYLEGRPPWDIGRPQSVFVRLFEAGAIRGRVFDAGCGTGEHSLFLAAQGLEVTGVDVAPEAIRRARAKAAERGLTVDFQVADVLDLNASAGSFDTVIDCGVFHVFDDASRPRYAASIGECLRDGGRLFILCFSEREPGDWGPRRVTQAEIREVFQRGWTVESIEAATFDTLLPESPVVQGWLAMLRRTRS